MSGESKVPARYARMRARAFMLQEAADHLFADVADTQFEREEADKLALRWQEQSQRLHDRVNMAGYPWRPVD